MKLRSAVVAPSSVPFQSTRRPASVCSRASRRKQQPTPAPAAPEQSPADAAASASTPPPQAPANPGRVVREFRALGGRVVEADGRLTGPEDAPDFWEGEKFDAFGRALEKYFLPGLVVLGLVCGGIAAGTYQDGADSYIKTPSSADDEMKIIDAATVRSVLGVGGGGGGGGAAAPSVVAE